MKHGHTQHGKPASPTYTSWHSMKQRCLTPNPAQRKRQVTYIDRGIAVCERWLDFSNFLADMGERPAGKTLDRVDNDKGYEPGNCRWATKAEQCANTSRSILITHEGVTQTAKAWAADKGIPYMTLLGRYRAGWPVEKILATRKFYENQFTNPRNKNHVPNHSRAKRPDQTSPPEH